LGPPQSAASLFSTYAGTAPFLLQPRGPTYVEAMKFKRLPARFVIPAQPALASKPPSGLD